MSQDKHMPLEGSGTLECMDHAAAIMFHLSDYLRTCDEKIRVTIERDPERGKFTLKREVIS